MDNILKDFELNNPDWELNSAKIFVRKKIFSSNNQKNTEGFSILF